MHIPQIFSKNNTSSSCSQGRRFARFTHFSLAKIRKSACAIKDCSVPSLALRHNGADVKFRPQFAFAFANANSDSTSAYACKKKPDFKKLGLESFLIIPHVCRRLVCRLYERLCYVFAFRVYLMLTYI